MNIPENIAGPLFSNGDIVSYSFEDAELTLILPNISTDPISDELRDNVCKTNDFTELNHEEWDEAFGYKIKNIVHQSWPYRDASTNDEVVGCNLKIDVLYHTKSLDIGNKLLNIDLIQDFYVGEAALDFADDEEAPEGWPSKENNFFAEKVDHNNVIGVKLLIKTYETHPSPAAFISLGRLFSLRINFKMDKMNYSDGRKNPLSDKEVFEFKKALFDELISNIKVEYSQETIELIEELKSEQA